MSSYRDNYNHLMQSGLYDTLTEKKWLIPHEEITDNAFGAGAYKILLPEQVPFISYPAEWSFDMLKEAALLTLDICMASLEKGMVLKDATPFNIKYLNGRLVFIDTLSFEKYIEGSVWVAYRQFCECFVAPLLLQKYFGEPFVKIFTIYPQGIPLSALVKMLPYKSKFHAGNYLHVFLHEKITAAPKKNTEPSKSRFGKKQLNNLLKGLYDYVKALQPATGVTQWENYYAETILSNEYLEDKLSVMKNFLAGKNFDTAIDLGCNTGAFTKLLYDRARHIIALDVDTHCINHYYKQLSEQGVTNVIPLIADIANPTPAIGWANTERLSLTQRLRGDLMIALAIVHHLAISSYLPFEYIASWAAERCSSLIIEFVPKTDKKVQFLLQSREDIFLNYTEEHFNACFSNYFDVLHKQKIAGSDRILYFYQRKQL